MILFVVCVGIFTARVTPVQKDGGIETDPQIVSLQESHMEWLDENYNRSMENGFCLFGHIEEKMIADEEDWKTFVVEDVEFVDSPFTQSNSSIRHTCVPQVLARWNQLVFDQDYNLIGAIHTHPGKAELSEIDKKLFRRIESLIPLYGIYDGETLSMYSDSDGESMPIMYRQQ